MKQPDIEVTRRDSLVSLLRVAQGNEEEQFDEDNGVTREKFVMVIAKEKGAIKLLDQMKDCDAQIEKLQTQRQNSASELRQIGFELCGSTLREYYNAPQSLVKAITDRFNAARRPLEKIQKKYGLAISRIWTATTAEEMSKVMEATLGQ